MYLGADDGILTGDQAEVTSLASVNEEEVPVKGREFYDKLLVCFSAQKFLVLDIVENNFTCPWTSRGLVIICGILSISGVLLILHHSQTDYNFCCLVSSERFIVWPRAKGFNNGNAEVYPVFPRSDQRGCRKSYLKTAGENKALRTGWTLSVIDKVCL